MAVGYSDKTGSATYGPGGWSYNEAALTPAERAEQTRRGGLAQMYRGYAENIPDAEKRYFQQYAGDVAKQQYGQLGKEYGQASRSAMQNLTRRGIMGSATTEVAGDLMDQRNRAELGIASQAQQTAGQMGEQARQQYAGLAGYYDQMKQQQLQNRLTREQATMGAAYQGQNALSQGQQYLSAAEAGQPNTDYLTPFLGSIGNLAGSYAGGAFDKPPVVPPPVQVPYRP